MRLSNEEYARRVAAIHAQIDRAWPYPETNFDEDQYAHEEAHWRRARAVKRIRSLPERWRRVPRRIRLGMRPLSTIGWFMCQAIGTMQLDRDASPLGLVARAWCADVKESR